MKEFIRSFKLIFTILPKSRIKSMVLMLISIFILSIFDILGLASIIPLITLVFDDQSMQKYGILNEVYNFLNLKNKNQFIIILSVSITFLIFIKNIFYIIITKFKYSQGLYLFKYVCLEMHRSMYKNGFLFFKENNSNELVRDIHKASLYYANYQAMGVINIFHELIVITIIAGILIYNNFIIFVITVLFVVVPFTLFYVYLNQKMKRLGNELKKIESGLPKILYQSIHGYTDIVMSQGIIKFRISLKNYLNKFIYNSTRNHVLDQIPARLIESALVLGLVLVILYNIINESNHNILTTLSLFLIAGYRIAPSVNRLMIFLNNLIKTQWVNDKVASISRNYKPVKEEKINFNKDIILDNITFRYPGEDKAVVKNIFLNIKKGQLIGLIGESGSGKTTILHIIAGFLKPKTGNIYIDGVILSDKNKQDYINKIGYVNQNPFLIDGTIAENIVFYQTKVIDHDKLKYSIQKAILDDFISSLPNGINHKIGESGSKISGGQRQRISIARAIYKNPEIFLFDEISSSLDEKSEEMLNNSISNLKSMHKTIFMISHNKNNLKDCDYVYNMHQLENL